MSFIYEALKRAEDDNARGVVAAATVRRPAFFAARPRWWLWVLIGILGANAALLVTLVFYRGSRTPAVITAATTGTERTAGPIVSPPPGANVAPVSPPSPPAIASAEPPVVDTPAPAGPPAQTVAPTTTATPSSARAARPAPRIAERPARPVTPSVPRVDAPPAISTPSVVARDTAEPRPASPRMAVPAAPVAPSGPAVAPAATVPAGDVAPPPAVDAPKLQIQVVVYSDVPAERMVIIDGRRYAEGGQVDADTIVERITPDGAIVTRRGQRFALTSGRP